MLSRYTFSLLVLKPHSFHFCDIVLIIFIVFYRVKLAIDLKTKKQVAVKILRTTQGAANRRESLDCFFTEINILTECRHPNIVKILDAGFDGTIIKE